MCPLLIQKQYLELSNPSLGEETWKTVYTWAINGADGASTATVWALHGYRTGPPGLPVRDLHG